MQQEMSYSDAGFALTTGFEGLRLQAYLDAVGVWTIGYGHTGPDVHPGRTITKDEAEAILQADLAKHVAAVNRLVHVDLTQGQFDALVDFSFNLGDHALAGSTLLRLVNAREFGAAQDEFPKWDHAGGRVLPGLLARRQAEAVLFAS